MRTLTQAINECFALYEKTSEVRAFKRYEDNPPLWYDAAYLPKSKNSVYEIQKSICKMLMNAAGKDIQLAQIPEKMEFYLKDVMNKYMNEFIDINNVPFGVVCGMVDEWIQKPANWKNINNSKQWFYMMPAEWFKNATVTSKTTVDKKYESTVITVTVTVNGISDDFIFYNGIETVSPTNRETYMDSINKVIGDVRFKLIQSKIKF